MSKLSPLSYSVEYEHYFSCHFFSFPPYSGIKLTNVNRKIN